jgi:soluble cytochrome b562
MQSTCGAFDCMVAYAEKAAKKSSQRRAKAERIAAQEDRKVIRQRKEAIKTRSQWMKEAQQDFNAFIRARDQIAGHACISSGRPLDWSGNAVDAGHYRSVGSAPHLRFHEDNCHAQSKHDNQWKSGNAVDYRIGLIKRIGLERVEALECDNEPRKYSIEDLKQIIATYREKTRTLKNGN